MGPAVRGLLERYGLSSDKIPASGPHGLLLKGDVLSHVKQNNLQPVSRKQPQIIVYLHNDFIDFLLISCAATTTILFTIII